MIAAANGQQISMTDSLNVRELQHLFKQWAQPPFTLPLNSQRDQPSRQEMKRVALAESDKEGEGEIKQKTTKKYKERTYSKEVLIFQKDSSLENTLRLLLLHFAKFSSSYRDKQLPQTKEDPPWEGSEVQQILNPKYRGVEPQLI